MASGPLGARFVGSLMHLDQPAPERSSDGGWDWNKIPDRWNKIRFDAIDVLFICLSFVNLKDLSFIPNCKGEKADASNASLRTRFEWVVRSARSKNETIKIVIQQMFLTGSPDANHRIPPNDPTKMQEFSLSAAGFIESWYEKTLPSLSGTNPVSARIDGFDLLDGMCSDVPGLLETMRKALDNLQLSLKSSPFSLAYSTTMHEKMDKRVALSCDYIIIQECVIRQKLSFETYRDAFPRLKSDQLVLEFSSSEPWENGMDFSEMKQKMTDISRADTCGIQTSCINSEVYGYENIFQVWLYKLFYNSQLQNSKEEAIVKRYWSTGGRTESWKGDPILPQDLV